LRHDVRQEFQGDEAPELSVLRLINDTHPTAAQLLDDAVVGDDLADELEGRDHWQGW
jgi:hypothetical protein